MMLSHIFFYLCLGAVAGLLSGLFGIGGGLIIVPMLIILFQSLGFEASTLVASAIATSLATICITSFSSALRHHKNGFVDWAVVRQFMPSFLISTFLGSLIVIHTPAIWMQLLFAAFAAAVALHMLLASEVAAVNKALTLPVISSAGLAIGSISALFGIGGGTLSVPFLSYMGFTIKRAIGTSAACGLPIAIFSAIHYLWQQNPTPMQWQIGYIYLPAFLGIVIISPFTAKIGAQWVVNFNKHRLKQGFAILLILVSAKLAYGVF